MSGFDYDIMSSSDDDVYERHPVYPKIQPSSLDDKKQDCHRNTRKSRCAIVGNNHDETGFFRRDQGGLSSNNTMGHSTALDGFENLHIDRKYSVNPNIYTKYDSLINICLGRPEHAFLKKKKNPSERVFDGFVEDNEGIMSKSRNDSLTSKYIDIILEGPNNFDPNYPHSNLWSIQVPITRTSPEPKLKTTSIDGSHFVIETFEDASNIHSFITDLLEDGETGRAIDVLSNIKLPIVADSNEISTLVTEAFQIGDLSGSDFIDLTLRNIGTIQLIQGQFKEAAGTFWDALSNDFEDEKSCQDSVSYMSENTNVLDKAATLVMLGVSLYGVGNFDDANRVFLKSLTIIRSQFADYASVHSTARRDNVDHHYTAGKVFNNIGCGFYELGFYNSSMRSFHRSLLVYMNGAVPSKRYNHSRNDDFDYSESIETTLDCLKRENLLAKTIPDIFIPDAISTLNNLAYVFVKKKNYDDASICLKEILALLKKNPNQKVILSTSESLAYLYIKMGNLKNALSVYEYILKTDEKHYATKELYHQNMAKVLSNMYYVYVKMNKAQSGFWCLKGVLAHQESFLPANDARLQQTRDVLQQESKKLSDDPLDSFVRERGESSNNRNDTIWSP